MREIFCLVELRACNPDRTIAEQFVDSISVLSGERLQFFFFSFIERADELALKRMSWLVFIPSSFFRIFTGWLWWNGLD